MIRSFPKLASNQKPLKRQLPRSRPMTIALGFNCNEGLVLCADREISNDQFSYYGPKITKISIKDGSVVLAQAGIADDMPVVI